MGRADSLLAACPDSLKTAMPVVTIAVRKPKSPKFKSAVLDAVAVALTASGVPPENKFQRVIELDENDFRFDPGFPDLVVPRDKDFVLIEILWSVGRSVKVKKRLLSVLMNDLSRQAFDTEKVMVYSNETSWEKWPCGGGRLNHI